MVQVFGGHHVLRAGLVLLIACGDNRLPPTTITGQVWADDNGNGVRDPDEVVLAGITVYANVDNDPSINASDPVTRTDDEGFYELVVPGPGSYPVRPVVPFGFRFGEPATKPTGPSYIIGGHDAQAGEFGFMVSLGFRFGGSVFPFCGGALITDRHVVTAAHCSVGVAFQDIAVIAGTLDPSTEGQVLEVVRVRAHPDYLDAVAGHDIAVWTLAEPLDLAAAGLFTVELLGEDTAALAEAGTLATTIGWGVSDRDSPLLQQVHLPVISAEDCQLAYPEATNFDTQICAGVPEGGIDSCQGDSGGPLLVRDEARGVWMHAGITSYGEGCALPGFPGVYARVSALAEWVKEEAIDRDGLRVVTVEQPATATTADFAVRSTTRPQVGAVAPRWQLAGLAFPPDLAPDTPVRATWSLVTDTPSLDGFSCAFEVDVLDNLPEQDVPCGLGANEVLIEAGLPTGIFAAELAVSRGELAFRRRVHVTSGSPPAIESFGALTAQDPFDPDWSGFGDFHIDYYEVTAISGTRTLAIEASATSLFFLTLSLYDLDQRSFVSGGGFLESSTPTAEGKERIVIVPEPGRRYLVGVSTFDDQATGSYVISIINDGTLTPR